MTWRIASLVVAGALVLLACDNKGNDVLIPGTPPNGGQGATENVATALDFYKEKVHPALDLTCTWCHAGVDAGLTLDEIPGQAPQWLALEAEQAYANIEAYGSLIAHPKNSLLLLQGEHMGPALQPKQIALVEEWLMMEVEERGLATPEDPIDPEGPPANTVADALEQFAGCMTRELWDQYEMFLVAHNQTQGWGVCRGCHNRGFAGAFLDDNQDLTYQENKKLPYLLKLVTAEVNANGAFVDLVPSNRFQNKGSEICTYDDPALCHPKYIITSGQISGFFNAVHANWKAGTCDDPPGGMGGMGGMGAGGAGGGQ